MLQIILLCAVHCLHLPPRHHTTEAGEHHNSLTSSLLSAQQVLGGAWLCEVWTPKCVGELEINPHLGERKRDPTMIALGGVPDIYPPKITWHLENDTMAISHSVAHALCKNSMCTQFKVEMAWTISAGSRAIFLQPFVSGSSHGVWGGSRKSRIVLRNSKRNVNF